MKQMGSEMKFEYLGIAHCFVFEVLSNTSDLPNIFWNAKGSSV